MALQSAVFSQLSHITHIIHLLSRLAHISAYTLLTYYGEKFLVQAPAAGSGSRDIRRRASFEMHRRDLAPVYHIARAASFARGPRRWTHTNTHKSKREAHVRERCPRQGWNYANKAVACIERRTNARLCALPRRIHMLICIEIFAGSVCGIPLVVVVVVSLA